MTINFPHPNGPQLVVVLLVIGLISLFVYFHMRGGNDYNFLDTLRDGSGKASWGKHMAWIGGVLAVWLIMLAGGKNPADAWPMVRELIGLALGYKAVQSGIAAWSSKPAAPAAPPSNAPSIGQQVNVTGGDAEVPIAPTRLPPAVSKVSQ